MCTTGPAGTRPRIGSIALRGRAWMTVTLSDQAENWSFPASRSISHSRPAASRARSTPRSDGDTVRARSRMTVPTSNGARRTGRPSSCVSPMVTECEWWPGVRGSDPTVTDCPGGNGDFARSRACSYTELMIAYRAGNERWDRRNRYRRRPEDRARRPTRIRNVRQCPAPQTPQSSPGRKCSCASCSCPQRHRRSGVHAVATAAWSGSRSPPRRGAGTRPCPAGVTRPSSGEVVIVCRPSLRSGVGGVSGGAGAAQHGACGAGWHRR